jgi:hypothetical protein
LEEMSRVDFLPDMTGLRSLDGGAVNGSSTETLVGDQSTLKNPQTIAMEEPPSIRHLQDPSEQPENFNLADWRWECAAAVLSLVCVAIVVILLSMYHNKTLDSWQFVYDISLNTLVALLSTISRTALLVPVASCISQLK